MLRLCVKRAPLGAVLRWGPKALDQSGTFETETASRSAEPFGYFGVDDDAIVRLAPSNLASCCPIATAALTTSDAGGGPDNWTLRSIPEDLGGCRSVREGDLGSLVLYHCPEAALWESSSTRPTFTPTNKAGPHAREMGRRQLSAVIDRSGR